MMFKQQAENCRQQANEYVGRPEAPFLLRMASAFDELAIEADTRLIAGAELKRSRQVRPPASA